RNTWLKLVVQLCLTEKQIAMCDIVWNLFDAASSATDAAAELVWDLLGAASNAAQWLFADNSELMCQRYTFRDLLDIMEAGSIMLLGKGGNSVVIRAGPSSQKVAIKATSSEDALKEVEVLGRLHHPSIIGLLGFVTARHESFLVYELAALDLFQALRGPRFDWQQRLRVLQDCVAGLCYLHSSSPKVLHCDMKSTNLFVDHSGRGKIGDFGLAVRLEPDASSAAGSWGLFRVSGGKRHVLLGHAAMWDARLC
ncbi:unnamed protein product, partial [Effrenium voratum]